MSEPLALLPKALRHPSLPLGAVPLLLGTVFPLPFWLCALTFRARKRIIILRKLTITIMYTNPSEQQGYNIGVNTAYTHVMLFTCPPSITMPLELGETRFVMRSLARLA